MKNNSRKPSFMKNKTTKELKSGYLPLGIKGVENYVFSLYRQSIVKMTQSDFSKSTLMNHFGRDFIEDFKFKNSKGVESFDQEEAQASIIDSCVAEGNYSIENIKGFGIFEDPLSPGNIIVNSDEVWGTAKDFDNSRIRGKSVFENVRDLKFKKTTEYVSNSEISRFINLLKSWNWKKKEDVYLVLGWILCAPFSGALKWRTHASLTGQQGAGKSTFQDMLKSTLSTFSYSFDGGSSEAGIRQVVKHSSCAVLIDESEADGKKLGNILTMLRSSSSGATVVRGTADQTAQTFELRMSGFLSGIVPPDMNPADLSRFLRLELLKIEDSECESDDVYNFEFHEEVGKKMFKVIADNYALFTDILNRTRLLMKKNKLSARYAETNGSLIAAAFMMLKVYSCENPGFEIVEFKDFEDKDISKFIEELKLVDTSSDNKVSDDENIINLIFANQVKSEFVREDSIVNHILAANGQYSYGDNIAINKREISSVLAKYGMKHKAENGCVYLYVDTTEPAFRKIFRDTKYASGDIRTVLKRNPAVEDVSIEVSIGNKRRNRTSLIKIRIDANKFNSDEVIDEMIMTEERNKEEKLTMKEAELIMSSDKDLSDDDMKVLSKASKFSSLKVDNSNVTIERLEDVDIF